MKFLEKDLEQIVWESDNAEITKRGMFIRGIKKRQLRIGNYGVADLVTFDRRRCPVSDSNIIAITVYEFKKDSVSISAFLQAIRYVMGIHSYLEKREVSFFYYFNIVLCGNKIDLTSDLLYLPDLINNEDGILREISLFDYNYEIDGLRFTSHFGYKLVNEGFNF